MWARTRRFERAAISLLLAWFFVSVFQLSVTDSLVDGIEGFRLMQAYSWPCSRSVILFRVGLPEPRVTRLLLLVLTAIAAYAALRSVIGSSGEEILVLAGAHGAGGARGSRPERRLVLSVFSLAGYLAPAGVFGLVLGYLRHRERVLSWTMAALAVVGVIGSYVRTALVAFVAGAAFLAAILTGGRRTAARADGGHRDDLRDRRGLLRGRRIGEQPVGPRGAAWRAYVTRCATSRPPSASRRGSERSSGSPIRPSARDWGRWDTRRSRAAWTARRSPTTAT